METQRKLPGSKAPATVFVHQAHMALTLDGKTVRVNPSESNQPLRSNAMQIRDVPLRKERRFFSITVKELDSIQYIMMGVTRRCWPVSPEWDVGHSIRYHSNDGGIFNGVSNDRSGFTYTKGDTVVCQALYLGRTRCLVEFLKNKKLVYRNWAYIAACDLHPTLGFNTTTATLLVDWPVLPAPDIPLSVSGLRDWLGFEAIERSNESNVVKLVQPLSNDKKVASLVAPRPFDNKWRYFEVEIVEFDPAQESAVAVGLASPVISRETLPGWVAHTVAYHSDDGNLHRNGSSDEEKEHKCGPGDVMGCGVVFAEIGNGFADQEAMLVTVYFTKNGKLVYSKTVRLEEGGAFPCVGFYHSGSTVKINTNAQSKIPTEDLHLTVAKTPLSNDKVTVTATTQWLCSVEAKAEGAGFVQFTTLPCEADLQCFSIKLTDVPKNVGNTYKVLVGLAEEMTSSEDSPAWCCSYNLTSGQIRGSKGINLTSSHGKEDGALMCMLDYVTTQFMLVMFYTKKKILGRATFNRPESGKPVCATVAVTGAGVKLEIDSKGLAFPTAYHDVKNPALSLWVPGDDTQVAPVPSNPDIWQGSKTSIQCPSFLDVGSSYIEVNVTQTSGQLPAIGISTGVSDLSSLIGGRPGEISFDPMTGEVIANNEIVEELETWKGKQVLSIGVGVLFTKVGVRVAQDSVVYFTINNAPVCQKIFSLANGGGYPTVTFPSQGCQISMKKERVYPRISESMRTAWLRNIQTNKRDQEQQQLNTGTFSSLMGRRFGQDSEKQEEAQQKGDSAGKPGPAAGAPPKTVQAQGKISFNSAGEAVITETGPDGRQVTRTIGALDKPNPAGPKDVKPPISSSAKSDGAKPVTQTKNTPVPAAQNSSATVPSPGNASENKTRPGLSPNIKVEQKGDANSGFSITYTIPMPKASPSGVTENSNSDSAKTRNPGTADKSAAGSASLQDTQSGSAAATSVKDPRPGSAKNGGTKSESAPAQTTQTSQQKESKPPLEPAKEQQKSPSTATTTTTTSARPSSRTDSKTTQPKSTPPSSTSLQKASKPPSPRPSSSSQKPSSSSQRPSSSSQRPSSSSKKSASSSQKASSPSSSSTAQKSEQASAKSKVGGESDSKSGGDQHVLKESQPKSPPAGSPPTDSRVTSGDARQKIATHIEGLSESQAKKLLTAISRDMAPEKMKTYLSNL